MALSNTDKPKICLPNYIKLKLFINKKYFIKTYHHISWLYIPQEFIQLYTPKKMWKVHIPWFYLTNHIKFTFFEQKLKELLSLYIQLLSFLLFSFIFFYPKISHNCKNISFIFFYFFYKIFL